MDGETKAELAALVFLVALGAIPFASLGMASAVDWILRKLTRLR